VARWSTLAAPLFIAAFAACAATGGSGGASDDSQDLGDATAPPPPADASHRDVAVPLVDGHAPIIDSAPPPDDASAPVDANLPIDANVPIDANPPPVDSAPPPPSCAGQPDGFNWDPNDPTARCCGGQTMHESDFTTNANCGVCGIPCNAANGESCTLFGGHWFCAGCVASPSCWSGCCSTTFAPTYLCSASNCQGVCNDAICPPGSHCVDGLPNSSDYCAY
jgi:hypothetical protein